MYANGIQTVCGWRERRCDMTQEQQEMKIATRIYCPMCDKKKCVGRFECQEIKKYIEKHREKV